MSLLDQLNRRMFYESQRSQANKYIQSRNIPEVEDIEEENEDTITVIPKESNHIVNNDFDDFLYIPQERFEDILNERCPIKEKTFFERAVVKTDRIRLTLSLFVLFDMIVSLMFNLFLGRSNVDKKYFISERVCITEKSLVNALILGLLGTGINIGFLIALRLKFERHKFSKISRKTSTFFGMIICGLFALHELIFSIADELNLSILKSILVFFKSILFGLGFINIFNIIFDFKTKNVTQSWARRSIRLFVFTMTFALNVSLLFYQKILKNRDTQYIDSISGNFLLSRLIISVNIFILFLLLWNGMNQLHHQTPILNDNILEFLKEIDNNHNANPINFQNVIGLCLDKRKRRRSQKSVEDDSFSIRTVKGGSFVIIDIIGIGLFSLAFTSELSHVLITTQNSHHIYPREHEFWIQFVFFSTILIFRILLIFQPVTSTGSAVHRDLLGHYSWHRNCHKYAIVFIANIIGNIMLIFVSFLPITCLYLANILIGFSLSLMVEKILAFISSYITITVDFFKYAIPTSLTLSSIIIAFQEYLSTENSKLMLLFYLNIITSSLSLLQVLIIAYGSCLHEDDSFDLIEMQTFTNRNEKKNIHTIEIMDIDKSQNNQETTSFLSPNICTPGPSTSSEALRSNSNSHLYWYQVAVKDGRRKSSMAVIATRIKYRLESIASILR